MSGVFDVPGRCREKYPITGRQDKLSPKPGFMVFKLKFFPLFLVLALLPATGYAVNVRFLEDTVFSRLEKGEVDSLRSTLQETLNSSPDQQVIFWQSDTSTRKSRAKIRYSYLMGESACRYLVIELTEGEDQRDLYHIDLCQRDGKWKVLSTPLSQFTKSQWKSLEEVLQAGLDADETDKPPQWTSTDGKFSAVFKFDLTETASDTICKLTSISVSSQEGDRSTGEYVFCKVDGDWERRPALEAQD